MSIFSPESTRWRAGSAFGQQRIDAPTSRAVKDNEKENPAKHEGQFASVHDREKLCRQKVHGADIKREIGYRHFPAREKRGDAREEPKGNTQSGEELDESSNYCYSRRAMAASGKREKLLTAMTGIRQPNNKPHEAVNWICKSIQKVHATRLMMSIFSVKPIARAK